MSFVIHHPELDTDKVVPEHTLGTYARRGWVIAGRHEEAAAPERPEMDMPARSASTAEWRTYAVVSGMSYGAAMDATRDELADKYNPAEPPNPPASAPRKRTPRAPAARAPEPSPPVEEPTADAAPAADTSQES